MGRPFRNRRTYSVIVLVARERAIVRIRHVLRLCTVCVALARPTIEIALFAEFLAQTARATYRVDVAWRENIV